MKTFKITSLLLVLFILSSCSYPSSSYIERTEECIIIDKKGYYSPGNYNLLTFKMKSLESGDIIIKTYNVQPYIEMVNIGDTIPVNISYNPYKKGY